MVPKGDDLACAIVSVVSSECTGESTRMNDMVFWHSHLNPMVNNCQHSIDHQWLTGGSGRYSRTGIPNLSQVRKSFGVDQPSTGGKEYIE